MEVVPENKEQAYSLFFPICYERGMRKMQFSKEENSWEYNTLLRDSRFGQGEKLEETREVRVANRKASAMVEVVWGDIP